MDRLHEIRLAFRRLGRRPGRGLATALTLAIGVGAATAGFAAVDATLLHDLPVESQDELVVVWQSTPERGSLRIPFRADRYDAVLRRAESFSEAAGVSAWGALPVPVEAGSDSYALRRVTTAGDFFGVLGVEAGLGRLPTGEDDAVGAVATGVLSHAAWTSRYGADPGVIGTTLSVDGTTITVVGVAPVGFDFPHDTELWTPLRRDYAADPGIVELHLVGRMAPGVDAATVASDVSAALSEIGESPGTVSLPVVTALEEHLLGSVKPVVRAAFGAALLLLLAAAANATLLLLAGGHGAVHDLAVRRALGAERSRLVGRLMADVSLVGAIGTVLGITFAWLILRMLVPLVPPELPRLDLAEVGWRAAAVAVALGLVAVALTGAVAGLSLSGRDAPQQLLGRRSHVGGGSAVRRGVAALQVCLTVVSAAGAGLLLRTVAAVDRVDVGFATRDMTSVSLRAPYTWFEVPETYFATLEEVVRELEARPGVIAARPTLGPPLQQRLEVIVVAEGQDPARLDGNPYVAIDAVLPGHFAALGIPILSGRDLTDADNRPEADPVAVVDEVLARALWPGEDAMGKRISGFGDRDTWFTVVGVAAATRYREFLEPHARAYYPMRRLGNAPPAALLVRSTDLATSSVGALVREALAAADPDVRVIEVQALSDALRRPTLGRRFAAGVLACFAGATLLLAALGIYGVFTVSVQERTREMGVRRALGARKLELIRLVLAGILKVALVGAVAGVVTAVWAGRLVESLLYGVVSTDFMTFAAVVLGSLTLAVAAGLAPALRASKVDPAVSLRGE